MTSVRAAAAQDADGCVAIVAGLSDFFTDDVLVNHVLDELSADAVQIVDVKTLDPSAGYAPYRATRAFWLARGFIQLDTIDPLPGWRPGNPAAILAVALCTSR